MSDYFSIFLSSANFRWVITGSLLLGFACGLIGTFVLLKKQSLISDAMAHAALPGVGIGFLFFNEKNLPVLLLGATLTSLLGTYLIQVIIKHSKLDTDAAIGVIISVFFGVGIVLLTFIQQHATGNHAGLKEFIFGQAASLVNRDVQLITVSAIVLVLITMVCFKEFKIAIFDPHFAKGLGIPVSLLNGVLMLLIVGIVVIGIQMVGVVLIAALLITPPLSARYWTDELPIMAGLSGVLGALSGAIGTWFSATIPNLPTGPMIVLVISAIFLISLLFGSKHGIVMKVVQTS
ncbi:metal ABC transporter permease [Amphibacillus jilinensis]|uniref:metal ABC transporter permease n=1 Tax=Amphibacillus jilinensis TaxID=1216008 RepID=UPI00031075B0|nr:iron chelate uptake ABC transporter family permease subunit [Amphibacillus jilinensis]